MNTPVFRLGLLTCIRRESLTENEKSERKKTISLLARLSGVPEKDIKTMDVIDFDKATEKVLDFLGVNSQESKDS